MKSNMGRSPLHDVVVENNIAEVKKLILEGANINKQDEEGMTPLHFATVHLNYDIVELLVEQGANLGCLDKFGNTPLVRALGNAPESIKIVQLLLDRGIDPLIKNKSGNSVIDHVGKLKLHPNRELFSKWLSD